MKIYIDGEKPFQVGLDNFVISPSNEGYVLHYSADGYGYTAWEEATPANEVLVVNGVPNGMYFKLIGNNTILTLQG
jgi:hypothetical protein